MIIMILYNYKNFVNKNFSKYRQSYLDILKFCIIKQKFCFCLAKEKTYFTSKVKYLYYNILKFILLTKQIIMEIIFKQLL